MAKTFNQLMLELGYTKYVAQGETLVGTLHISLFQCNKCIARSAYVCFVIGNAVVSAGTLCSSHATRYLLIWLHANVHANVHALPS